MPILRQKFSFGEINLRFYLFKALVGVDVVEPGELVVVEEEGGRVQDQLRGGPGQEKMVMMKKMVTITT